MATLHSLPPMTGMTNAFPYGFGAIDELLDLPMVHPYLDWLKPRKVFLDAAIDRTMPRGFIHGDLFWDNLVFDGDSLAAVLDFEEACHYYLLFDLGMCVVGCCSERGKLDIDRIRHLVGGYQACRQMTGKEHSQMVPFMEYAAVVASLWRFRQYTIRRPDPEKADSYQELSVLAEQIRELDMSCLI
jgi:homoserine kinase type II